MANELKLIQMSSVQSEEVRWLWYPYIPLGKLTIVQGDPGEGKTTLVLALIASLTRGSAKRPAGRAHEGQSGCPRHGAGQEQPYAGGQVDVILAQRGWLPLARLC